MKKFAIFASALMLAVAAIGLAGCGGHYSETFAGKLSADGYSSADTAAAAFLENEIAAEDTAVAFVSYTRTGDISDKEMEEFDLGDVKAEEISSKEWGKIAYTASARASAQADPLAEQTDGQLQVTVGMFKIGDAYRYFVPLASTGEMISKSYYESVFDAAKYKNCTTSYTMTLSYDVTDGNQSMNMKLETETTMKITESVAMMELWMGGNINAPGASQKIEDVKITYYLVEDDDSITAYFEDEEDGSWHSIPFEGAASWDELYGVQLKNFLDYSYFEKTSTGFKLAPIKFNKYVKNYILSSENSSLSLDFSFDANTSFDGEANYYVTEGRLSEATVKIAASYSVQGGVGASDIKISVSGSNKFYDFGSTSVTLPDLHL